jgi:putative endonuclease
MAAFVYILYSRSLDKFYIGNTTEPVKERLRKHLSAHSGFTSKAKDWELVFTEELINKSQAYRRELQIKGWKSKKRIQDLVSNHS